MKTAIQLIAKERAEQIFKHKRTIGRDVKENTCGQLRTAAIELLSDNPTPQPPYGWAYSIWEKMISKPIGEREIIAAALIAADIDRRNKIKQLLIH